MAELVQSIEIGGVRYPAVAVVGGGGGDGSITGPLDANDNVAMTLFDENGDPVDWLTPSPISLPLEEQHPTTSWRSIDSGTGGLFVSSTANVELKAADAALRLYIDGFFLSHPALSAPARLDVNNGAGGPNIFRIALPAAVQPLLHVPLPPGIFFTDAATALSGALSASVTGGIYAKFYGHLAA